jgi:energy-coupling factor transporter ATP-binding protein EcfA2
MSFPWPAWLVSEDLVVVPDDRGVVLRINGPTRGILRVPRTAGALAQLEVVGGEGPVAVRALTPSGVAMLERLAAHPGPVAVIVTTRLDRAAVTLAVYIVPFHRVLDEPLRLGVDEQLAGEVARRAEGPLDAAGPAGWLMTRFVAAMPRDRGLLLASHIDPAADLEGGMQLHARDMTLYVSTRPTDGALVLERIAPAAGRSPRLDDTLQLIEGHISFVEDTYASKVVALRREVAARSGAAAAAPTSRYLEVWAGYEEESVRRLLARGRRFGTLRFTAAEARSAERWELVLASAADEERIVAAEDVDELVVHERRPSWMDVDPGATSLQQALQRDRGAVRVTLVAVADGIVSVDAPPDRELPAAGLLAMSLAGDMTQGERREQARAQLPHHPDLELALADHNVELPGAARRRLPRPLPAAVTRVFGDREPNASQLRALRLAYESGGLIAIQGPPGTGKTTVVAAIEQLYAADVLARGHRTAVLVSATQHDAVENVLDRSAVLGLPAIKHGRRSGESQDGDARTAEWARERERAIDRRLARIEGGALADAIMRALRRARSYLAVALPPAQTALVLRDLAQLGSPDGSRLLRARSRDALNDAAGNLERDAQRTLATAGRRAAQLRSAAALLRTTPVAFEDDGPQAATRALALLRAADLLDADGERQLERAEAGDEVDHAALVQLRDRILDDVAASGALARRALRDERATSLVAEVIEELQARLLATPSARALALARYRDSLVEDVDGLEETLARYLMVVGATTQQSATLHKRFDDDVEFRVVVVDEAARAHPLDLLIPLVRAKECKIVVGDHRQLPQHVDEDVVGQISTTKGLAAGELLQMSLFERLYQRLNRSGRAVTLNEQYRMHPRIGRFVSDTFYPHDEQFASPRPARDFEHRLRVPGYVGRVVRWLDVPPSREHRVGRSWARVAEAEAVVRDVVAMMEDRPELSFGLISMYGAQVDECWRALASHGAAERSADGRRVTDSYRYCRGADGEELFDAQGRWVHRLRVGTVDAFQGREFDVVVVSLVRSNSHEDPQRRFGFTLSPNRLNVAMSRAKRLLVVAGDWQTFGMDVGRFTPIRAFHALCAQDEVDR